MASVILILPRVGQASGVLAAREWPFVVGVDGAWSTGWGVHTPTCHAGEIKGREGEAGGLGGGRAPCAMTLLCAILRRLKT